MSGDYLEKPRYVDDEGLIHRILSVFVDKLDKQQTRLKSFPIQHKTIGVDRIVSGFKSLESHFQSLGSQMTLKALSARFFWGDSKFLSGRQDLLEQLFPLFVEKIAVKPLLINISIPENFEQILFIENEDTFIAFCQYQSSFPDIARSVLVYSAGFKGSASRVREKQAVTFAFLSNSGGFNEQQKLETFWFSEASDIPCYFFGDYDYSGMAILAAIRQSFKHAGSWRPGYDHLQKLVREGRGHAAVETNKAGQNDPGETGCGYADAQLLPALRSDQQFIDQEALVTEYFLNGNRV